MADASPLLALVGKVALITGSSRSIGAAIAIRLAAEGARVIINYHRNPNDAEHVASAINAERPGAAVIVCADVSTFTGIRTLLSETLRVFGSLDILVLNASSILGRTLSEVQESDFDKQFNVSVKCPLFLVQAALPHLRPGKSLVPYTAQPVTPRYADISGVEWVPGCSRVIFISSALTRATTLLPKALIHVGTRGAVEQISRVLAKDLGAWGISVNTVSPGMVNTPLFRVGKTPEQLRLIASLTPERRIPNASEIAPTVAFLAREDAGWVNGVNLSVNGGYVV